MGLLCLKSSGLGFSNCLGSYWWILGLKGLRVRVSVYGIFWVFNGGEATRGWMNAWFKRRLSSRGLRKGLI